MNKVSIFDTPKKTKYSTGTTFCVNAAISVDHLILIYTNANVADLPAYTTAEITKIGLYHEYSVGNTNQSVTKLFQ